MDDTLTPAGARQETVIPDIRGHRFTDRDDTPEHAAILKRILQNKGVEVPVAAFQSSI